MSQLIYKNCKMTKKKKIVYHCPSKIETNKYIVLDIDTSLSPSINLKILIVLV